MLPASDTVVLNLFARKSRPLGPCIGHVTPQSAKIWLQFPTQTPLQLRVTLHSEPHAAALAEKTLRLSPDELGAGTVTFEGLKPDTRYFYRISYSDGSLFPLPDLSPEDLQFRTFPADETPERLDFLLLSCHDPVECSDDGFNGFRVWSVMDQIRERNDIRFAILAGDQVYGDHVQEKVLGARTEQEKLKLYLSVYQKLWDQPHYRKTLCSLPAYLIWDDHDITDGWGSRSDAYLDATSSEFRPEWLSLFGAARKAFSAMQASRNPEPLSEDAFDFCFRVGRAGFAVADVRSHRNVRRKRVWKPEQLERIRSWVDAHRSELDCLFFVTPVVVTHGWPQIERVIRKFSPLIMFFTQLLVHIPLVKSMRWAQRLIKRNIQDVAGFRDDLEDAWSSDPNKAQAEELMRFLFSVQNPVDGSRSIPVVILSGDIHAAGYSMVYSSLPEHRENPVIEHVCSSPVGSKPMGWLVEALYQQTVNRVPIGTSGCFTGQVSHHYCQRNVVVLSLRRYGKEMQLKMKYYLEDKSQPEILLSDLKRVSGLEHIRWDVSSEEARKAA